MGNNNLDLVSNDYTGTYSPEDDKLRLYSVHRLDDETYQRIKEAGFRWAPKQDLFFAFWSPNAEDILIELTGVIGDEDTSLVSRAEQRSVRFDGYKENRLKDAETAYNIATELSEDIPLGQPILVGHHSEKRARRTAKKIERATEKAIQMWDTSQYWLARAKGCILSAEYKERPDVRARRIKKLEAEIRKYEGYFTPCPKTPPNVYDGKTQVWCGKGRGGRWVDQEKLASIEAYYSRYIAHNENRLMYERAMLEEQGATDLLKPPPRPKQAPLLNYRDENGINIPNRYHRGEFIHHPLLEMTKAEYASIPSDYKGGQQVGDHRVRVAIAVYLPADRRPAGLSRHAYGYVFLTDSKVHAKPEGGEK